MSDADELRAELQGVESALKELKTEYDKGMIDLGQYMRLKTGYETSITKTRTRLNRLGDAALERGDLEKALDAYRLAGNDAKVNQVKEALQQRELAALEQAEEKSRDADESVERAKRYYNQANYDVALGAIGLALTLFPNRLDALILRGQILLKQGKFEQALKDYERAYEQESKPFSAAGKDYLNALHHVAEHYWQIPDHRAAAKCYQRIERILGDCVEIEDQDLRGLCENAQSRLRKVETDDRKRRRTFILSILTFLLCSIIVFVIVEFGPTLTLTSTPTETATNTPTEMATSTPTTSIIPTVTPTNTWTPTPLTPTLSPTLTSTSTLTPAATTTNTPTPSHTLTPTGTPTNTPTPSHTPTGTATNTPTGTATNTPEPSDTPIQPTPVTPSPTPAPNNSPTPMPTPAPNNSPTPMPTSG